MAETIRVWVEEALIDHGYPAPVRARLALLLAGLVGGEPATVSGLSRTLHGLAVTPAQEPSIARRLLRLLDDPRLDPAQILPAVFRHHLPDLLAGLIAAHAANEGTPAGHHARFRPVQIVVDETSQEDAVHLLVVGLLYQGLTLPLAVRVWTQNVRLAPDDYWTALGGLLWEVHGLLPPVLRDHVLLLADRGYGHPRMVDLATSLGWGWVLRASGQVRVQFPDGTERALRELVPGPGTMWGEGTTLPVDGEIGDDRALRIFKKAGWRHAQVVAVWLRGQAEPWLLVTNLPAQLARMAEYARRWAIERLFLSWKSHGWDLEAGRVRDAARLGRLVSGLVLATWWRIACALPATADQVASPATRSARQSQPRQLTLPFLGSSQDLRPWAAKFSLFTWGRKIIQAADCARTTPALDWTFPFWDAPSWPTRCQQATHATT